MLYSSQLSADGKRLFLDLGRVEVIAEVKADGRWPSRLIGDEQFPAECEYGGGMLGPTTGTGGATGGIAKIPDWYAQGKSKPKSPRVAFTTWKWYSKDDPLLESGLLGPVMLRTALRRPIEL